MENLVECSSVKRSLGYHNGVKMFLEVHYHKFYAPSGFFQTKSDYLGLPADFPGRFFPNDATSI